MFCILAYIHHKISDYFLFPDNYSTIKGFMRKRENMHFHQPESGEITLAYFHVKEYEAWGVGIFLIMSYICLSYQEETILCTFL